MATYFQKENNDLIGQESTTRDLTVKLHDGKWHIFAGNSAEPITTTGKETEAAARAGLAALAVQLAEGGDVIVTDLDDF